MLASPNVVIARFEGGQRLTVLRSLRGNLRGSVTSLRGTGRANVEVGTTVVAFLDADRRWNYVAEAGPGATLAAAPLRLRGFYDFDASMVEPGVQTLATLEAGLRGERPALDFTGPLEVLAPDGRSVVATTIVLDVHLAADGTLRVSGLPSTAGLPAPTAIVGSFDEDLRITYCSGYPRPFALEGAVDGVDAAGRLVTRFHAVEPEFLLREADLRAYLADANAAYAVWALEVRFDDGVRWTGTIGEHYEDGLSLRDARGVEVHGVNVAMASPRSIEFDGARWALDAATPGPQITPLGDNRVLLEELHRGPVRFAVTQGAGAGRRGEIRLGARALRRAITAR